MREIVFDTETTGLDKNSDRVIEIGAVELVNRFSTGRRFHVFINPEGKQIHPDAEKVHGINNAQLADKPVFADIVDGFLDFIDGAKLVAHNASFDTEFINAEFGRLELPPVEQSIVIDTLLLARRKHPMGPNSLDGLCKRYNIDNSHRTLHGALLDAELLAEVYLELTGGRQAAMGFDAEAGQQAKSADQTAAQAKAMIRPAPLPPRLSEAERAAHAQMVKKLGAKALWLQEAEYSSQN
jgi:DNA polymerase III subunit epsilon